ncbi:NAD-binding protein [Halogeometricum sp. S1BR25-6]|uniref:NAD-binding protein n=1 Tax=Halogeometricum salsisoli TaxID=2950536 RepID=A0ABU2G9T2_9EURY|nr:NAD-binding protein [Halogeometricum sp. S1BR25-6]MDS0297567.1 NAD-binding protein [Halogeometricum sp. S1BR25-6]
MRELQNVEGFHPRDLSKRQRLLVVYAFGLVAVVLVYTYLYNVGMRTLEGRPQSMFRSFNAVIATLTTTGFGSDAPWTNPLMLSLLGAMQVTGVVVGFVTLRVLVIPLFERAPLELDDRLSSKDGHVVVAEYGRDTDLLLDELEALETGYVLLESDQDEAKRLSDEGYQAIHGDPEKPSDLRRASVEDAAFLVADAGDRTAGVVLTALELNEDLRVVGFSESPRHERAFAQLGVDRCISPHALVGRRLAQKATTPVVVDPPADGGTEAGADGNADEDALVVRELLVGQEGPLCGVRLGDSPLADRSEVTAVAGWFDGELRVPLSPDDELAANTVLVVAGPPDAVAAATGDFPASDARGTRGTSRSGALVVGRGEGGRAAADVFSGVPVTTVDRAAAADPDVVGDATDPETFREAGISDASTVVVTVGDDSTALLTAATARSLSDDAEILVRMTDAGKVSAAARAGTDYALSAQRACARVVAAEVRGERVVDPAGQIRLVRAGEDSFVGESLADLRGGDDGRTVVGVVRDGAVETDGESAVAPGDYVLVVEGDGAGTNPE